MDAIIRPLSRGGNSAIVNVFFPCELLQAFGIHPLFAEGLSCYLNGAWAEKYYLRTAEEAGVSPNFCSYHKALLGGRIDRPDPQAGFHRLHLPGLRRQQPDLPAAGPAL